MSHRADLTGAARSLFGKRSSAGRWLYLVALALPAVSVVSQSLIPYWSSNFDFWLHAVVSLVCIGQFFWPTLAVWAVLAVAYAWIAYDAVMGEIGAFQDIGSEDHSRWEGWPTEWKLLALTIFIVLLAVSVALRVPRKPGHAT